MANTVCYNVTKTGCNFTIDNLENPFNTDYYISAGVATGQANGTTTPPTGIKGSVNAYAPPILDNYAQGIASGLTPGTTYTLYGYGQTANGKYWPAGSATFTTKEDNPRPSNFSWTYPKTSGGDFNLTALEWYLLTSRINSFRTYKGLNSYSFTNAVAGNDFTAAMFNQARAAISAMGVSVPPAQSSGNDIYASHLNGLVSSLNSIQ